MAVEQNRQVEVDRVAPTRFDNLSRALAFVAEVFGRHLMVVKLSGTVEPYFRAGVADFPR